MDETLNALLEAGRRGEPAVLVTVAAVKGSVPREAGAKMVVLRDAIAGGEVIGTIGGGHLEFKAIDIAREMLAASDVAQLRRFPLGATLGQCCGGLVQLLFEPVAPKAAWLDVLAAHERNDEHCTVVTSTRGAGAAGKLIVSAHGVFGTLGDDALDAEAIAFAKGTGPRLSPGRQLPGGTLKDPETKLVELQAGDRTCLCLFDPHRPVDWRIVLFGAGHVGQALVRTLAGVPCRITWVDTRDAIFPRSVPANVDVVATDTPLAEVDAAPAGAYFLVMTHSHALDQELTECILRRNDCAYFGLIGSASKRRQFERRLAARGLDPACFAAMTCPIGVDGIKDKRPAAIAIAVAAELLQRREAAVHVQAAPRTAVGGSRGLQRA
ncbi:MAG TPA: xanthine dehydrogenase accessory protein XdhC [Burkholderiaceae bacterium]|nr:xanthine dehydrogenase accessory protein XdhC [Burkholderiaceae bacterium]